MVPNPEERKWFDGLQRDCPFPLVWRGGDWLDARLAEHPAIVRHFMGTNDAYVALVRELKEEQEALVDGLPAAVPRIEQLAAKVNDSNPFYKVDYDVRDGQVDSWSLRPKYPGAEKDSPVAIRFNVVAGRADPELVESVRSALTGANQWHCQQAMSATSSSPDRPASEEHTIRRMSPSVLLRNP